MSEFKGLHRSILALLVFGIFSFFSCSGGSGNGSGGDASSGATASGVAVKGPIDGAEVMGFHFDANGGRLPLIAHNAPVFTDDSGRFDFMFASRDIEAIQGPIILETKGGTMHGGPAPTLSAIVVDASSLSGTENLTVHLSAGSSIAGRVLENTAEREAKRPTSADANTALQQVRSALDIASLSEDPTDPNTGSYKINQMVDDNLLLLVDSSNNLICNDLFDYLSDDLSSNSSTASGRFDGMKRDPSNPAADVPITFADYGRLADVLVGPDQFWILRITSDKTIVQNSGADVATLSAYLTNLAGTTVPDGTLVRFDIVSGAGTLSAGSDQTSSGLARTTLVSVETGTVLVEASAVLGGKTYSDRVYVSVISGSAANPDYTVLAYNDLGMHCMDREFSIFSILPPFNVVHAQIVRKNANGSPRLLTDADANLFYNAVADATGSINSTSVEKTDFWQHANSLFTVALRPGEGLAGQYMPADHPQSTGAQRMDFDPVMQWYTAEGIPITPYDDNLVINSYPLMRISGRDPASGQSQGYVDAVVPVSIETDCKTCHASGQSAARNPAIAWAGDADLEIQAKKNILLLHDYNHQTSLQNAAPVLCATCHYSPALDLAGDGPQNEQLGLPSFSRTMHAYHGQLTDSQGNKVFSPDAPVAQTCYQCHPGRSTQCLRGAMKNGGMECKDCHGDMLSVGGVHPLQTDGSLDGSNDGGFRRPWMDLPRCQSCHTGDAVSHLTGADLVPGPSGIRLKQAYRTNDPSASPLLAVNKRFAENAGTLYRNSKGHSGIGCEGCHGSTHAVWPNADSGANDNVTAIALQGFPGKIIECSTCHVPGTLSSTLDGPHGMHNVGSSNWIDGHERFYDTQPDECKACHGLDLTGTVLSKMPVSRTVNAEGRSVQLIKGQLVGCNLCHENPL